jgi:hypothetical protein
MLVYYLPLREGYRETCQRPPAERRALEDRMLRKVPLYVKAREAQLRRECGC